MKWFLLAVLLSVAGVIVLLVYDWRYLVAVLIVSLIGLILAFMYSGIGGPEHGPPDDEHDE